MSVCLKFPDPEIEVPQEPVDRAVLTRLRFAAKACRASARLGPERACSIIDAAPDRAMTALVSALSDAVGRPVRTYALHETEMTFDERWVLSAIAALGRNDLDSVAFLVSSRVPPHIERWMFVLLRRVTDALGEDCSILQPTEETRNGTTSI
ncbi:hypothetical protein [Anianabacter salinae]|uniref:hypothetical protein n=1 Tax=Anianabacter salinae TaxID=2851023 RepID=UPI00225E2474|nr:hypothetical protein [Anianabacter salinae]MBV0911164.1 hypothetical protein [Anianabacter salinae]